MCLLIHESVCLISKPICLMMMMMMMHYVTEFVLMPLTYSAYFLSFFSFDPLALPWCVSICLNLYTVFVLMYMYCSFSRLSLAAAECSLFNSLPRNVLSLYKRLRLTSPAVPPTACSRVPPRQASAIQK